MGNLLVMSTCVQSCQRVFIVRDGTHFLWLLLFAIELTHAVLLDVIVLQIGTDTLLLLGKVNDTTLPV